MIDQSKVCVGEKITQYATYVTNVLILCLNLNQSTQRKMFPEKNKVFEIAFTTKFSHKLYIRSCHSIRSKSIS